MASSLPPAAPTVEDIPLFDGFEAPEPPKPEPELSADQRRTRRQAQNVADGIHPLTGGRLHPLASRHRDASAPKNDPFTCGSCWFKTAYHPGNRVVAKCIFGGTNEHHYVTDLPRITGGPATDVRAWWPACPDYSPGDSLSPDAARSIPTGVA